jgi:hypothetical protein
MPGIGNNKNQKNDYFKKDFTDFDKNSTIREFFFASHQNMCSGGFLGYWGNEHR